MEEGAAIGSLLKNTRLRDSGTVINSFFASLEVNEIGLNNHNFAFGFALYFINDELFKTQALQLIDKVMKASTDKIFLLESWVNLEFPLHEKFTDYLIDNSINAYDPFSAEAIFRLANAEHCRKFLSEKDRLKILEVIFQYYSRKDNFDDYQTAQGFGNLLTQNGALTHLVTLTHQQPELKNLLIWLLSNENAYHRLSHDDKVTLVIWFLKEFEPSTMLPSLRRNDLHPSGISASTLIAGGTYAFNNFVESKREIFDEIINEKRERNDNEIIREFSWLLRMNNSTGLNLSLEQINSRIAQFAAKNNHYAVVQMGLDALNNAGSCGMMMHMGYPPPIHNNGGMLGPITPEDSFKKKLINAITLCFNKLSLEQKRSIIKRLVDPSFNIARLALRDFIKRNFHYSFFDFSGGLESFYHKRNIACESGCSALEIAIFEKIHQLRSRRDTKENNDEIFSPHHPKTIEFSARALQEICDRLGLKVFDIFRGDHLIDGLTREDWKNRFRELFGDKVAITRLIGEERLTPEDITLAVAHFQGNILRGIDVPLIELQNSSLFAAHTLHITILDILVLLTKYIENLKDEGQKQDLRMVIVAVMASDAAGACYDGFATQLINAFYSRISGSVQQKGRSFFDYAGQMMLEARAIFNLLDSCIEKCATDYFSTEPFQLTGNFCEQLNMKQRVELENSFQLLNQHTDRVLELISFDTAFLRSSLKKALLEEPQELNVAEQACVDIFMNVIFYPALLANWTDSFYDMLSFNKDDDGRDKLIVPSTIDTIFDVL